MSNAGLPRADSTLPLDAARVRAHAWRLALLFAVVVFALWGFGALAEEMGEGETLNFDLPILKAVHTLGTAGLDQAAIVVSRLGYAWGVIPLDVLLVVALWVRKARRESVFALLAVAGSGLANVLAKHHFARARPSLWISPAPEATYSFPSGHAMGSMTLAMVVVLLAWNTRWRWWVAVPALVFAVLVGFSRVYLGVHYPTDILAGWTAAVGWVVGVYAVLYRAHGRPWGFKSNLKW